MLPLAILISHHVKQRTRDLRVWDEAREDALDILNLPLLLSRCLFWAPPLMRFLPLSLPSSHFPLPIEISIKHLLRPSVPPSDGLARDLRNVFSKQSDVSAAARLSVHRSFATFGRRGRQGRRHRFIWSREPPILLSTIPWLWTDGRRWRARNGTCTRSAIFIGRRAKAVRGLGEKRSLQLRQWPRLPFSDS